MLVSFLTLILVMGIQTLLNMVPTFTMTFLVVESIKPVLEYGVSGKSGVTVIALVMMVFVSANENVLKVTPVGVMVQSVMYKSATIDPVMSGRRRDGLIGKSGLLVQLAVVVENVIGDELAKMMK